MSYINQSGWINYLSDKVHHAKLEKLTKIGKTRWWAKADAFEKMLRSFSPVDLDESYIDVLIINFRRF